MKDFDGVKMVSGAPHCPAMPVRLNDIRRPAQLSVGALKKNATAAERAEHAEKIAKLAAFNEAIAERETWAFRRVVGPDTTGKERWTCPAQAGKRRCERCPISLRTGDRTDALAALDPEDHGFEELEPATGGPGITSPPLGA